MTFKAGDAHHEEFVQVVGRNRQEAYPLQQGMMFVPRLFPDAAVEMQPGQFPVDKPFRVVRQGGVGRRRRRSWLYRQGTGLFINRTEACPRSAMGKYLNVKSPSGESWPRMTVRTQADDPVEVSRISVKERKRSAARARVNGRCCRMVRGPVFPWPRVQRRRNARSGEPDSLPQARPPRAGDRRRV